jgi:hypothetical protein
VVEDVTNQLVIKLTKTIKKPKQHINLDSFSYQLCTTIDKPLIMHIYRINNSTSKAFKAVSPVGIPNTMSNWFNF